jgi:hypothetical protein
MDEWVPNEKLCRIICTHISEDTEPAGKKEIPDFSTRWLHNIKYHNIRIERERKEGFDIITKTNRGNKQIIIVIKDERIVLLWAHLHTSMLETLIDDSNSKKAMEILNIDPDDCYDWKEVKEIV